MDNFGYKINYKKLIETDLYLGVTKKLAKQINKVGYISVGNFIKKISDQDLENLLDSCEDDYPNQYGDLLLISEMLAIGEGGDAAENASVSRDRLSTLVNFLTIESLNRKGMVKVYHENMSLHEDSAETIVVEKLE